MKELSSPAYDGYAADDPSRFLMFPAVKGLNGQKVGMLLERDEKGEFVSARTLKKDIEIFRSRNEEVPAALTKLDQWWDTTAVEHADNDRKPVEESKVYGMRRALYLTAGVPAFMCLGYLILVIYFKTQGGYKPIEI